MHIAVAPVTAEQKLEPGTRIAFVEGSTERVKRTQNYHECIGVVDPFLYFPVEEGERFWMFMLPGSITSLHHEWTHPAFVDGDRAWIEDIARQLGIGSPALMQAAKDWLETGDYTTQFGSQDWSERFPQMAEKFWEHYARVTGIDVPQEKRESFFSCSC